MAGDRELDQDPRPLHERAPTSRFSDRVADYVRYRPSYPAEAIDAVLAGLGDPHKLTAADIGAGTGISSRLLADRGVQVWALEPNAEMRAAAAPHGRVQWAAAAAEATGLATGSVDLVVCAQAFHWFRQEEALAEFARILQPRGRLALIWNDDDQDDAAMAGYRGAVSKAAARDWPVSNPFFADSPAIRQGPFRFEPERVFKHGQVLDEAGLIGRARSASYVPREGAKYDAMVNDLSELIARHREDGRVKLGYRCRVYLAGLAAEV